MPPGERRISIHAPRTGSDISTSSGCASRSHFNPRSPHGERRLADVVPATHLRISIHAPRTGSDALRASARRQAHYFNPRSPHGERLVRRQPLRRVLRISIHAPRTGSDDVKRLLLAVHQEFQSTLPARGATALCNPITSSSAFQSTLPARGATFPMRSA